MSNDTASRNFPHLSKADNDSQPPAAEDPLVELARIVGGNSKPQIDDRLSKNSSYYDHDESVYSSQQAGETAAAAFAGHETETGPQISNLTASLEAELMGELRSTVHDDPHREPSDQSGAPELTSYESTYREAQSVGQTGMGNRSQEYGEYRDPELSGERPDAQNPSIDHPHYPADRYSDDPYYNNAANVSESAYPQEPRFTDAAPSYPAETDGRYAQQDYAAGRQVHGGHEDLRGHTPRADNTSYNVHHDASADRRMQDDMAWPDADRPLQDQYGNTDPYAQSDDYDPNSELFDPLPEDDYYAAQNPYEQTESDQHDGTLGTAGVLPPHSAAEQRAAQQSAGAPRRGFLFASVIVLIMMLGGGGLYAYNMLDTNSVSGPPQIILADTSPMKVVPEGAGTPVQDANRNKLIYDRVGGNEEPAEERLIVPEETKIAELPNAGGTVDTAPAGSETRSLPRRVRTVVVRPDGTIINGDAEGAETQTAALSAPATTRGLAAPATPLPEAPADDGAGDITASIPGADSAAATPESSSQTSAATAGPEVPAEAVPAQNAYSGPLPKSKPQGVRLASNSAAQTAAEPLNLTPNPQQPAQAAAEQPAAATTEIPRGTYMVQVASQRSQEAAQSTYYSLRRRFPQILGNVNPVIQVADLGDRGVYYRVRIPMSDQQTANSLCSNLKSAGGDCFVKRN